MDFSRKDDGTNNIPHMHLFMYLKRKFPSLKDAHITDSIQRFGLDKGRCEEELNRRSNDKHRGYNSPWNRSRASSRSSTGSRNSPLSPSDSSSHISSPMHNGSSPSTPISGESFSPPNPCFEVEKECSEHPSEISLLETSPGIHSSTAKAVYSNASNARVLTSPAYNDSRRIPRQPPNNGARATNGFVEFKRSPNSAPVLPNSVDDDSIFDIPPARRRSSAETVTRERERLYLDPKLLRQVSPPAIPERGGMEAKGSPSLSPSTPTITTTTMSPSSTAPLPVTTQTVFSSYPGTRHITSLHFIPCMPHGAHHNPVPPAPDDGNVVCVGGRSYTSVNLQLRQPTADPQPPINIRSDGSSLSYSTSSMDHKQGSRSSLQISIGPSGGSISAMRTNLKVDKPANTAFHIQYSANERKDASPGSASLEAAKDRRDALDPKPRGPAAANQIKYRPHSLYLGTTESPEYISVPRSRRTSLPETTGPPPLQHLHYPPSTLPSGGESPFISNHDCTIPLDWVLDPFLLEAALKEQISRRERLKEVLARRIEEKSVLESEVRDLSKELEEKQKSQKHEIIKHKKEIKEIQEENGRFQCACDEMEREILESGESPKTDQERQAAQREPLPPPSTPHRPAPQPPSTSGSSFSSVCSGVTVPTSNPILPTRRAPSPPTNAANPYLAASRQEQASQRVAAGNDDGGNDWSCSKCTLINSSYLNECELCGFPHFSLGTPPSTQQFPPQNPLSSAHNHGGPCYCHHRRHYNMNHEHRNAGELQDIHIQVRHQSLHSPMREI